MRVRIILTALVAAVALLPAAPASADTTTTTTTTDQACVDGLKAAGATAQQIKDGCIITSTTSTGAAEKPTTADLQAMSADSLTSLSTALAYPRYCKNWAQNDTTTSWRERHIGRFCYDHHNAYIWNWGGYHRCDLGWTLGWDLVVKTCAENRINDSSFQGGYFRQNWDYYKVCLISKYLPVCFSYNMHVNVFPSGNITYHKG